jgi:hypothetical protein
VLVLLKVIILCVQLIYISCGANFSVRMANAQINFDVFGNAKGKQFKAWISQFDEIRAMQSTLFHCIKNYLQ